MSAQDVPLAFPSVAMDDPGHYRSSPGMTLRDWFAGQAITGIEAPDICYDPISIARNAYTMADAMLAARLKEAVIMVQDESPWIEWAGGECPVPGALVHIKLRDGTNSETTTERILPIGSPMRADFLFWQHGGEFDPQTDIIAYRLTESQP